ncbi:MAG TPA: triose-phosphate isomerase [Gemmatimonadaceae bacterium]|nr:triose-phosphate isomerase [Gemmatimonadaceae bacterium]
MSSARRRILAANWKMNHGPTEARAFMAAFLASYSPKSDRSILIFPPALSLTTVRDSLGGRRDIQLGVQNIYTEPKGAFTGESSAAMARDAGAAFVLVGHSERRHVFGETDEMTAKKVALAVQAGLTPMLCVGEKWEEREKGATDAVVLRQLRAGVAQIEKAARAKLLVAYEPVWAIGTGKTATPADASAVHAVIRGELASLADAGDAIPILYGGSVNKDNAKSLLDAPGVDGLLVGGASLEASGWSAISST